MHRAVILVLVSTAVAACTSTYVLEYHPTTVTSISQNVAYPVNVGARPVTGLSPSRLPATAAPLVIPLRRRDAAAGLLRRRAMIGVMRLALVAIAFSRVH